MFFSLAFVHFIHDIQMAVTSLKSWKIDSTHPFYPLGIHLIGNDANNRAVITHSAHNVNTFIFRNFVDNIKNDRPALKSYLHKTFFPERIKEILVGANESAILFENGRIKCFTSPKSLTTVEYLSCVKSICASLNGFVLIKTAVDGTEFFVEFHPDSFGENGEQQRKTFNISLDKVTELQITWHENYFKIKELSIGRTSLLRTVLADVTGTANGNRDLILFLSIDNNFCYLIIEENACIVNMVTICPVKIVDFWSSSDGDSIIILLESGTLEILHGCSGQSGVSKKAVHCGNDVQSYHFFDDKFFFSNNAYVECITFEKNADEITQTRQCFSLPGIVALTYLPEMQLILCTSENCCFYTIRLQDKKHCVEQWIEINGDMQTHISNLKCDLIELTDAYDTLLNQQQQQQQIQSVIKLKQNDERTEVSHRFVGHCSVTQTPPIQQPPSDESVIYLSNSMAYDRTSSFFVSISIAYTTKYANEFDADLWKLFCKWTNDKHEQVYANIKLKKGQLTTESPLTLIIHLNQKHLPSFDINLSAVGNGSSLVQINFPVKVKQPNYFEMVNISKAAEIDSANINANETSLICTVPVLSSTSMNEILGKLILESILEFYSHLKSLDLFFPDKLKCKNRSKAMPLISDGDNVFVANLMGRELTIVYSPGNKTVQLITKDADLMNLIMKHFHGKNSIGSADVKVSADAIKEYNVSCISYAMNVR